MRTGRPRLPTAVHQAKGTYVTHPERRNHNEPKAAEGRLECPPHLDGIAARCWHDTLDTLEEMRVATLADGLCLELLCVTYQSYREACEQCDEMGDALTVVNEDGEVIKTTRNPFFSVKQQMAQQLHKLCAQFGLTPSSRTGIKAAGAPKSDPLAILHATR